MDTLKRGLDGIERIVKKHTEMAKNKRNSSVLESDASETE